MQEDNTSLDEQEAVGRDYCRTHGLVVGIVHRETFTGYQYRERKKLEAMRERYREGKIQGVVIRTLDRLSRNQTHVAILMEEMEHCGVTLHCVKESIDDTAMGKFVRMVLAFVGEMEREKIMDRTMTARVSKAKQGKIVSGKNPRYGWKWHDSVEKDYLVIDKKPAAVIRWAAIHYARGVPCLTLVKQLEAWKVPPPSGEGAWTPRTLRRLLVDKRNTGKDAQLFTTKGKKAKQNLETVDLPDGTYPALLSDVLHARIVARATVNQAEASRNGKNPTDYLLRAGFIRCAECKRAMVGCVVRDRRWNSERLAYICQKTPVCPGHRVPAPELDKAVWESLVQLSDYVPLIEEAIRLANNSDTTQANLRAVEAALESWHDTVNNYTEDLQDRNLRGDTRASIRQLLNDANAVIERLEAEKAQIIAGSYDWERERQAYQELLDWCKQVTEAREELSYQQKRDFLRMLGVVVMVDRRNRNVEGMSYDIRVALPSIQAIIYQQADSIVGQSRRESHDARSNHY